MKKLLLFLIVILSIMFVGCKENFEGKYSYFDLRQEKAALYFEEGKVRYTLDRKEVGIFDYTYNKKEKTLTIDMNGESLVFVYNKKEKTLSCDIYKDSITRVFNKDNY